MPNIVETMQTPEDGQQPSFAMVFGIQQKVELLAVSYRDRVMSYNCVENIDKLISISRLAAMLTVIVGLAESATGNKEQIQEAWLIAVDFVLSLENDDDFAEIIQEMMAVSTV